MDIDATMILSFFAGCLVMMAYFAICIYRRNHRERKRHASSLPPITEGDPFTVFECDSEWYYTDNFGVTNVAAPML